MRCLKCGKEIPDNSTFCIYCGSPQAKASNVSSDDSSSKGFSYILSHLSTKSKIILGIGVGVIAAAAVTIVVLASMPKSVKLLDDDSLIVTGFNGTAKAYIENSGYSDEMSEEINELYNDLQYSSMSDKKEESEWKRYDAMHNMAKSVACELTGNIENLSNGDVVTVTCTYDDDYSKYAELRYTDTSRTYTISGLEEPPVISSPLEKIDYLINEVLKNPYYVDICSNMYTDLYDEYSEWEYSYVYDYTDSESPGKIAKYDEDGILLAIYDGLRYAALSTSSYAFSYSDDEVGYVLLTDENCNAEARTFASFITPSELDELYILDFSQEYLTDESDESLTFVFGEDYFGNAGKDSGSYTKEEIVSFYFLGDTLSQIVIQKTTIEAELIIEDSTFAISYNWDNCNQIRRESIMAFDLKNISFPNMDSLQYVDGAIAGFGF